MSDEMVAGLVFAMLTLLLLTGGVARVVWVLLFDEFIGVAHPRAGVPPMASRFEVVLAGTPLPVAAGGKPQVQTMTPGR